MKIAIVGGGISGLVCGYYLNANHDITVFDSNSYIGGHTHTITVNRNSESFSIDTGFIVFNDRTYPNFVSLLERLSVASQPTPMSFSVRCEASGLEYRGADLAGLFSQRRNFANPSFYRLLWDCARFNRLAHRFLNSYEADSTKTLGQFIQEHRFSNSFVNHYLLPMGSAIWSCPRDRFLEFPIYFIAQFFDNHGLLALRNRPTWQVIQGGSRNYIGPLTADFSDRIRLNSPVVRVRRLADQVWVETQVGESSFDHVIFACHSDQALRILGDDAVKTEREVLAAFPYEPNIATLHTQSDLLPERRRAWASWNYFVPAVDPYKATVTYNMNILQSIKADCVFCVTLNDNGRIRQENIIDQFLYHHPVFSPNRYSMQQRHNELINTNRTSFCGAYWGNGFHEDGVVSALKVVERLNSEVLQRAAPTRSLASSFGESR